MTPEVMVGLLTLLRTNEAYSHFDLPMADDDELRRFAGRLHFLADIGRDGKLNQHEFKALWLQLPSCKRSDVLGPRYGSKYQAVAEEFVFGTRSDWLGGLQSKLGPLVTRSIEVECSTNDGGRWRKSYEYIVKQAAKPVHRPEDGVDTHGAKIIFDEGHDGWGLKKFHELANERGTSLSLVEVGVLRMYTADFYVPWNNALRGLDLGSKPDHGAGLQQWAVSRMRPKPPSCPKPPRAPSPPSLAPLRSSASVPSR